MAIYTKNGQRYVDYYVEGRRLREKVGPCKKLAKAVECKRKTEIAEGKFLDRKKELKVLFRDFAPIYMETHSKPNKRSWMCDDRYLKNLTAYFGDRYLHEITPMMVEKYKAGRKEKLSAASVNRELALLKCMFSKAIDWGKTQSNPVKKVKLFKENNCRGRYFERDETSRQRAFAAEYSHCCSEYRNEEK